MECPTRARGRRVSLLLLLVLSVVVVLSTVIMETRCGESDCVSAVEGCCSRVFRDLGMPRSTILLLDQKVHFIIYSCICASNVVDAYLLFKYC